MHGKGLLHLDVKPHNILIAAQGGSLLECAGVKAPPFGGWPAGGGAGGAPSSVAPVPGLAAPALAAAANRPPRLTLLPLHEVTLKVADFGISKAVAATAGAAATAMPVGTEGWRAPETYVPASAYAVKQTVSAKVRGPGAACRDVGEPSCAGLAGHSRELTKRGCMQQDGLHPGVVTPL